MMQRQTKALPSQTALRMETDMKWQPIETAPKDGTDILVYFECATVPIVHIAWYRTKEEWESSGQYCGGWDTLEKWEGWWSYTRSSVTQEKLDGFQTPTHWLPMPEVCATDRVAS